MEWTNMRWRAALPGNAKHGPVAWKSAPLLTPLRETATGGPRMHGLPVSLVADGGPPVAFRVRANRIGEHGGHPPILLVMLEEATVWP